MIKIQMDTVDIEKLLTAYCPQMVQHTGNTFLICFGEKQFVLGDTELVLKTDVEYDKLKGNLNCKLCGSGAEISIGLK